MDRSGGIVSQDLSTGERFVEIQKFYSDFVGERLIQKVFEVFKLDFELFNYNLDGFIGENLRVD